MRLVDFGQTMRKYRMRHGLTQENLGNLLGVQARHIGLLENGHRDPSPAVQHKMENLLLKDEWGRAFLNETRIISDDEIELVLSLYQKLCRVHPVNRSSCLNLLYQVLDTMARVR